MIFLKHNSILISLFPVGHDKYFELVKESRNATNFYVKQLLPAGIYSVSCHTIFFIRLIDPLMSLFGGYKNVQMFISASMGGVNLNSPIFYDSSSETVLNLTDSMGYIDLNDR